jgi:DNA-binding NtrC family response regulator
MNTILIMDGEPLVLKMLAAALKDVATNVLAFQSPQSCLAALAGRPFRLAVINVAIGDEHGLALACVAAAMGTPTLLITPSIDAVLVLQRHGIKVLGKPFEVDTLIHCAFVVIEEGLEGCERQEAALARARMQWK